MSVRVLFQNRVDAFEHWGGDTTQMVKTKKYLERLGCYVDVDLTVNPDVSTYDIIHVFNIQTSLYSLRQVMNAKDFQKPVALSTIYWDMRDAEVAHALHSRYSDKLIVRIMANVSWKIPRYIHVAKNLVDSGHRVRWHAARRMLELADIVLPNSYAELEIIASKFRAPWVREKACIIPNGVDLEDEKISPMAQCSEKPVLPDDEYVLEVARIEPIKNQIAVIEALMDSPEIPLVFVGRDLALMYSKRCRTLAKKRGNTYFVGEQPHANLGSLYDGARVHVLPSFRESPGLATLEAGSRGVNCVVSHLGPVTEYFRNLVWYCDPYSVMSIRRAILHAWNSPRQEALKRRIRTQFTWEVAAAKTLDAYKQVLR